MGQNGAADGAVPAKVASRAYLVTGAGFSKIFWPCLMAAIYLTHGGAAMVPGMEQLIADAYDSLIDRLMRGAHSMMWWSAFGLLSSSCCAVQLVLNMFNFGCAGFNTYLGPVRPCFLAITVALQIRMWELAVPNFGLPSTPWYLLPSCVGSTVFTSILAFLPELTDLRTRRQSRRDKTTSASGRATVVLSLEGLGCVACTSAVMKTLEHDAVASREVSLELAEARLTLNCPAAEASRAKEIAAELATAVEGAGFGAVVASIGSEDAQAPLSASGSNSTGFWTRFLDVTGLQSGAASLVAGLLSSSCCLLQLGVNLLATLNIVHVGCAGFNKVLGPVRLYLRCATAVWMGVSWLFFCRGCGDANCQKPRSSSRRLLLNAVLCICLTFLPELLRLGGGPAIAPPTEGALVLKFNVSGMGCEACEMHVRGVMERSSGVISSRVDFERGTAEVEVAKDWRFNLTEVKERLAADGYEVLGSSQAPAAPVARSEL